MNKTLTLKNFAEHAAAPKLLCKAGKSRVLAWSWEMPAVVGLMASGAVYGLYALTQMTGF